MQNEQMAYYIILLILKYVTAGNEMTYVTLGIMIGMILLHRYLSTQKMEGMNQVGYFTWMPYCLIKSLPFLSKRHSLKPIDDMVGAQSLIDQEKFGDQYYVKSIDQTYIICKNIHVLYILRHTFNQYTEIPLTFFFYSNGINAFGGNIKELVMHREDLKRVKETFDEKKFQMLLKRMPMMMNNYWAWMKTTKPINIVDVYFKYAWDLTGMLGVNVDFSLMNQRRHEQSIFAKMQELVDYEVNTIDLPYLIKVMHHTYHYKTYWDVACFGHSLANRYYSMTKEALEKDETMMAQIALNLRFYPKKQDRLNRKQFGPFILVFLYYFSEATQRALITLTYFLAANESVQAMMVQEIDEVIEKNNIDMNALQPHELLLFSYSRNVFLEGLRLCPPFFGFFQKINHAFSVDKQMFHRNEMLYLNHLAIFRQENLFGPEPKRFNPSRWDRITKPRYYRPFGLGVVEDYCVHVVMSTIIHLIMNFHLTLAGNQSLGSLPISVPFSRRMQPVFVHFKRRVGRTQKKDHAKGC
mmetsp:Transcript_11514/g.17050  ORF Transcript_11514/g.17050 Transcript_11514/m.17050 type:complete len:524 (+) Transcript_11514:20-1591(+)